MTIFRLWTTTNSDGLPTRGASSDWWHWCRECHRLTRLRPDPAQYDEPKAPAADHGGAPDHITQLGADVAASHECVRRVPPKRLAVPHHRTKRWTEDDDRVIIAHTPKDAAAILGRAVDHIHWRRRRLIAAGLLEPMDRSGIAVGGRPSIWTPEMDADVLSQPQAVTAQRWGVSVHQVRRRAARLRRAEAA